MFNENQNMIFRYEIRLNVYLLILIWMESFCGDKSV